MTASAPEVRVADGDWTPHNGLHHFAKCGEWRPVSSRPCPRCEDRCPACGTWYAGRREERPS